MKSFKLTIFFAAIILLISGCANLDNKNYQTPEQIRMSSALGLLPSGVADNKQTFAIDIPSAGNFLSDQLMIGLIKSGMDTNHTDALVDLLNKTSGTDAVIVVTGKSDAVTAASIEGALKRLFASGFKTKSHLFFVGEQKYGEPLKLLAKDAGVNLDVLTLP